MIDENTKSGASVDAMFRFGSGFVRGIAQLWSLADSSNKLRVESAFAAEFAFYLPMSKMNNTRKNNETVS